MDGFWSTGANWAYFLFVLQREEELRKEEEKKKAAEERQRFEEERMELERQEQENREMRYRERERQIEEHRWASNPRAQRFVFFLRSSFVSTRRASSFSSDRLKFRVICLNRKKMQEEEEAKERLRNQTAMVSFQPPEESAVYKQSLYLN